MRAGEPCEDPEADPAEDPGACLPCMDDQVAMKFDDGFENDDWPRTITQYYLDSLREGGRYYLDVAAGIPEDSRGALPDWDSDKGWEPSVRMQASKFRSSCSFRFMGI